jgi:signal transduction histidine kinase
MLDCSSVTLPFRRPSGLTLLVGAALILLPILAILQYRWIGQVSDAERERRQRTLQHATTAITQEVDVELVRAVIGLQVDGTTLRTDDWTVYSERAAGWHKASAAPGILRDVLLVDRGPDGLRLRRWSDETRHFVEIAWPADLSSFHERFASELAAWDVHTPDEPLRPADLLSADGATMVVPIAPVPVQNDAGHLARYEPVFGYTLIRLDMPYVKDEFLPSLVDKHFRLAGDEYRIAVVWRRDRSKAIYQANADDLATLVGKHDAEVDFFGFHPDQFQLVRQAADSLGSAMPTGAERRRSLFISMTRRPATDANGKPLPFDNQSRWTLVARHRAGSLEASVEAARRRNLILGFGVLLLMFASVAVLARTADKAGRLVRQQMEFVAAVSHELRTPVSVIGSAAENLADGFVNDPARVKQYGVRIQTEARRLGDTVERVLLYAGIEAGRGIGHRTPMAVSTLVGDALAASTDAIEDAKAVVETDIAPDLPPILADATGLRSSLQNLIANALKYGGSGRWVRVAASKVHARGGAAVRIAVSDRGLGIAASDLPHIFEPFYRGADAQSRQIRGNGLGLSIVKGIVEAHGGSVRVESTPGKGSTFAMTLPAHVVEASPAGAVVTHAGASARGT